MKHFHQSSFMAPIIMLFVLGCTVAAGAIGSQEGSLDHRDDYQMDSISGGNFRDYISAHILEDDPWAHSMRAFGSFHNHMHELMTQLARHGAEERGDGDQIPEFTNRISGGGWASYRKALEEAEDDSAWYELVRITEIMHDRVHHAMARSLVRDRVARTRDVDLSDYLRGEAMAHGEGIPAAGERNISEVSLDDFRELAWRYDAESRYLHESVQSMIVFAHMLDDLLAQWLDYGEQLGAEGCQTAPGLRARRGESWSAYVANITACEEAEWREFTQVAGLMRDRIHHMLHMMMAYSR